MQGIGEQLILNKIKSMSSLDNESQNKEYKMSMSQLKAIYKLIELRK